MRTAEQTDIRIFIIHVYNIIIHITHNNAERSLSLSLLHTHTHAHTADGLLAHTQTHRRTQAHTRSHNTTLYILYYYIIIIIAYVCGVHGRVFRIHTDRGPREKRTRSSGKRVCSREEGRSSVGLRCRIVSVSRCASIRKRAGPRRRRHRREMD